MRKIALACLLLVVLASAAQASSIGWWVGADVLTEKSTKAAPTIRSDVWVEAFSQKRDPVFGVVPKGIGATLCFRFTPGGAGQRLDRNKRPICWIQRWDFQKKQFVEVEGNEFSIDADCLDSGKVTIPIMMRAANGREWTKFLFVCIDARNSYGKVDDQVYLKVVNTGGLVTDSKSLERFYQAEVKYFASGGTLLSDPCPEFLAGETQPERRDVQMEEEEKQVAAEPAPPTVQPVAETLPLDTRSPEPYSFNYIPESKMARITASEDIRVEVSYAAGKAVLNGTLTPGPAQVSVESGRYLDIQAGNGLKIQVYNAQGQEVGNHSVADFTRRTSQPALDPSQPLAQWGELKAYPYYGKPKAGMSNLTTLFHWSGQKERPDGMRLLEARTQYGEGAFFQRVNQPAVLFNRIKGVFQGGFTEATEEHICVPGIMPDGSQGGALWATLNPDGQTFSLTLVTGYIAVARVLCANPNRERTLILNELRIPAKIGRALFTERTEVDRLVVSVLSRATTILQAAVPVAAPVTAKASCRVQINCTPASGPYLLAPERYRSTQESDHARTLFSAGIFRLDCTTPPTGQCQGGPPVLAPTSPR